MRVTNTLFYSTSVTEHQSAMKKLYDIDKQLASGMKIQNSFENSAIYVDTMRLNYEIATLEQTKETSSKAQTFALNTDSTMNQIEDALEQFKTKLIQANSSTHSSTSLNAIADELEGLKRHLVSLGNTSINGQYLFSGSSLLQKPLEADGTYVGNAESLNAIVGSGVELPYNISGDALFLGTDSDYHRVVSTNVSMYNQSKLHPDTMVINSGVTAPEKVYLTATDTIRDMVGDTDNDNANDPNAVFHVSGRRSDGSTFDTSIEMQSHEKISALLEKIGQAFGNTPTNHVVDVTMSEHGQIEIKDLSAGNQQLQFHIVGAVDRSAALVGAEGYADNKNLIAENVQIVEFIKSNFVSANTSSTISSRQDIFSPGQFTLGAPMFQSNGTFVESSTKLRSFMGDEINQIKFSGTNNAGTNINPIPPLDVLHIDDNTTVQQLLSAVESAYGVSARLEDGQIYLSAGNSTDFDANQLHVKLDAYKYMGDGEVQSVKITNAVTADGNITLTLPNTNTVNIAVLNGDTTEDVALKIEAAMSAIQVADPNVVSVRADGDKVYFDFAENGGDVSNITLNPNATGSAATVSIESDYISAGLAEVQSFEIKESPAINGTFTLTNTVSPANDLVVNFNAGDTPTTIATAIAAAVNGVVPFTDANGNQIASASAQNGTVTFTYDATDGNVVLAPISISQTAGVDDLIISNAYDRTVTQGSSTISVNAFTNLEALNFNHYNFIKDGNTLSSNVSQILKTTNTYATESTKLIDVAGISSLHDRTLEFNFINMNGVSSHGKIDLKETSPYSSFQIDFDNSGTYEENETIPLFDGEGSATKASEVTYKQLMDVLTLALSGQHPTDKDAMDTSVTPVAFETIADGNLFDEYQNALQTAKVSLEVSLDYRGKMIIKDKMNTDTTMQLSLHEHHTYSLNDTSSSLSFMANDAIKIENPSIDFFKNLDDIITSVRKGEFQLSADNENPRSLGMNYAIDQLTHILDHVTKEHTKIGAYSNALGDANERAEYLSLNVKTVRSSVIDVDTAEAYLQFNQISNSYQAMLSTIAKINSMSLLNYM